MYITIVYILKILLFIFNGRIKVQGKEYLPDSNYILVAPHRSFIDPIPIALAGYPDVYIFMVKEELKQNPILNFLIKKLDFVPVNRQHPGPSSIKKPVRILKEGSKSFMLFPTGSRYSTDIKDGATTIGRMSKKPIVPCVYSGPLTIKDLLKRKKMKVGFGPPIPTVGVKGMDYKQAIIEAFNQIEKDLTATS